MPRPIALASLLLAVGCESGTSEYLIIDVSEPVATSYADDAPGLLRTSASADVVAVLCGDALSEPAEIVVDHGLGCLDEADEGTTVTRSAWIEPMPDGWDAAALCALPAPDPVWSGVGIGAEITGHDGSYTEDFSDILDPSWPQQAGEGTWERDASPCGGSLEIELTIP